MKIFTCLVVLLLSNYCANAGESCTDKFIHYTRKNDMTQNKLYVLNSKDKEHEHMNENFIALAQSLGFHTHKLQLERFCSDGLLATQSVAQQFKNVVNLKVKVPVTFDAPEYLTLTGYTGEYDEQNDLEASTLVCNISGVRILPTNNGNTGDTVDTGDDIIGYNETCVVTNALITKKHYVYVKLASKIIEQEYSLLYQILNDFTLNYRKEDYSYWNKYVGHKSQPSFKKFGILVCKDNLIFANKVEIDNKYVRAVNNCNRVENFSEHNLSAALVPRPLRREDKTYMPVIFYNIPFILPEHEESYPNAVVLHNNHLGLLAEAMMKLLESKEWRRIAIVSDDSPYSDVFEAKLVDLFQNKGIIYKAKQCLVTEKECDFKEALKSLKEEKTTIIIANVEEKNADNLVKTASSYNLKSSTVAWIFRGWPFKSYPNIMNLGDVYSMYLTPATFKHNEHLSDNVAYGISIIRGILKLPTVKEDMLQESYGNRHLYRAIYQKMVDVIKATRTTRVNLRQISSSGPKNVVFSVEINIHSNRAKITTPPNIGYLDTTEYCMALGNSFVSPCEDTYVLIMICVLCVVLLIGLVTLIVVQKYGNRQSNYRNFS